MRKLLALTASGILTVGACIALNVHTASASATDLQNDVHSGETGQTATANDKDTAQEFNVDDNQVGDVQSENGQIDPQETGSSSTGQDTADSGQNVAETGQSGPDASGDSDAQSGGNGG